MVTKFSPGLEKDLGPVCADKNLTQFTEGDLHANFIRLVEVLHHYRVITLEQYNTLYLYYRDYLENPNNDSAFKYIDLFIDVGINITDSTILIRLIGDVVCDRTGSDAFSLKLIDKLVKSGKDIRIMMSNHDIHFVLAMHGVKNFDEFKARIRNSGFVNHANQAVSLRNLQQDIEKGRISFEEVQELSKSYNKTLTLLDFSINEDSKTFTIYSHAPINFAILAKLADQWGLKFPEQPCEIEKMQHFINQVNVQFKLILEKGKTDELDMLFNSDASVASSQVLWNRENEFEFEQAITSKDGYTIHFKNGHDRSAANRPKHYETLDNDAGKGFLQNINSEWTSIGNSDHVFPVATPSASDKISINFQASKASKINVQTKKLIKEYIKDTKLAYGKMEDFKRQMESFISNELQPKMKVAKQAVKDKKDGAKENWTELQTLSQDCIDLKMLASEADQSVNQSLIDGFEKCIQDFVESINKSPDNDAKLTSTKLASPTIQVAQASEDLSPEKGPASASSAVPSDYTTLVKTLQLGPQASTKLSNFLSNYPDPALEQFIKSHFDGKKYDIDTINAALSILDRLNADKVKIDLIKGCLSPTKGAASIDDTKQALFFKRNDAKPTSTSEDLSPEKGPASASSTGPNDINTLVNTLKLGPDATTKLLSFLDNYPDQTFETYIRNYFDRKSYDIDTINAALSILDRLNADKGKIALIKNCLSPTKGAALIVTEKPLFFKRNDEKPTSMKVDSPTIQVAQASDDLNQKNVQKEELIKKYIKGPKLAKYKENFSRYVQAFLENEFNPKIKEGKQANRENIKGAKENLEKLIKLYEVFVGFREAPLNQPVNQSLIDGFEKCIQDFVELINKSPGNDAELTSTKVASPTIEVAPAPKDLNPEKGHASFSASKESLYLQKLVASLDLTSSQQKRNFSEFLHGNPDKDLKKFIEDYFQKNLYDEQSITSALYYLNLGGFDKLNTPIVIGCLNEQLKAVKSPTPNNPKKIS